MNPTLCLLLCLAVCVAAERPTEVYLLTPYPNTFAVAKPLNETRQFHIDFNQNVQESAGLWPKRPCLLLLFVSPNTSRA